MARTLAAEPSHMKRYTGGDGLVCECSFPDRKKRKDPDCILRNLLQSGVLDERSILIKPDGLHLNRLGRHRRRGTCKTNANWETASLELSLFSGISRQLNSEIKGNVSGVGQAAAAKSTLQYHHLRRTK